MDWNKRAKALGGLAVAKKLKDLSEYDLDDALNVVGLHRRASRASRFWGGFGLVLGGMAVGAVLGMMLAPRGKQMLGQQRGSMPGMGGQKGYGTQPVNVGSQGSNFS